MGVRGLSLDLIKSFLLARTQIVLVNNVRYGKVELNFEISQGSVLGPIMFVLYTT